MDLTLLICGCKSYLHEQQTSDKLLWWIHQHPCLEHPKALGSHQQIRNPWGTDQTRACNLGRNPLLHKASWLFKATSFQIMGYGWLWFVAIHSRGNHSHILLLFLPTKGHLWRQSVNDSSHPQSKLLHQATCSRAILIHPKSEGLWHSTKLWSTYPECKKTQVLHLRVKRPTWYACYLCFLYFLSRLSMKTRKRNSLQPNPCPRVSRNSIKTRYACGSQLSKVMKPLDFTSKCRHNLTQLAKKEWLLVWKGPLFYDSACGYCQGPGWQTPPKVWEKWKQCPGGWHTSKARDKWGETNGDEQTKGSGEAQAPKVRNKWRETAHQAHLASKWTSQ